MSSSTNYFLYKAYVLVGLMLGQKEPVLSVNLIYFFLNHLKILSTDTLKQCCQSLGIYFFNVGPPYEDILYSAINESS